MLIDFVHLGDAYLPELQAYEDFLAAAGHGCRIHRQAAAVPADATVVWWMCGRVPQDAPRRWPGAFQVHEYASASVPPWDLAKDRLKRWRQPRPDYRLFQNEWVRERMRFADNVPFDLRDMGLPPAFLAPAAGGITADHGFVYLGEMRRLRHFLHVFDALGRLGHRVLLVGDVPPELAATLGRLAPVTISGRVPNAQVPSWLRRARVGLNLVPRQPPFTHQTSTKLLEYCAAGLHVLSTEYPWVRAFEARHGGRFAYLPATARGLAVDDSIARALELGPAPASFDLEALAWPRLLSALGVWRVLGVAP